MSLLNNAKTMGGIGAILTLLGIIPSVGFFLGIIGFILILVAVKYISDETKDKSIFNNFLYFFIFCIIGVIVTVIILVITVINAGGITYINELQTLAYSKPMDVWNAIQPLLTGFLVALLILCVFIIISAIYLRKSYDKIGELTNVKWFGTAGLLFLIGAATLIIGVGFIIILIAMILEIIAFFSLPDKLPEKLPEKQI
jgi:uncharacterized membrane protein